MTMQKKKYRRCITVIISMAVCFCLLLLVAYFYIDAKKKRASSQEGRFEDEIRRYELMSLDNPPTNENTIFIGSSNFAWWGSDLEKQFEQFHAVNRGFGGAQTTDILRTLDRLVLPYKPNRVVIFIGGNDIAHSASPDNVFENFKRILEKIWTANPRTKIFFVSPTLAPSRQTHWEKMKYYNQQVFDLSQKLDGFYHIDITNPMNDTRGHVRTDFYLDDGLHLNGSGRELWVRLITAAIEESQENPILKTDEQLRFEREENDIF